VQRVRRRGAGEVVQVVARLTTPVARRRGLRYPTTLRPRGKPRIVLTERGEEAIFQAEVVQLARLYGWRHYHTYDSRGSVPGFPDLVLVRGVRLIFVELKVRGRKPRDEQEAWLGDLRATCAEVYVWYPRDMPIIASILRRRAA